MKIAQAQTAIDCFHGLVQSTKAGQHALIMSVMKPKLSYTGQELSHLTGLSPNVISARLFELREELKWVIRLDERKVCPHSNVLVHVHSRAPSDEEGKRKSELCRINATRHGLADSRVHRSWMSMRQRCLNKNDKRYADYGGRGISICERWMIFENFLSDMGSMPDGHTLDRIDVNGNYEPNNCRWANSVQQARNQRTNRLFTFEGETHCLSEWAEIKGVLIKSLSTRLDRGWTFERAITTPFRAMKAFARKPRNPNALVDIAAHRKVPTEQLELV